MLPCSLALPKVTRIFPALRCVNEIDIISFHSESSDLCLLYCLTVIFTLIHPHERLVVLNILIDFLSYQNNKYFLATNIYEENFIKKCQV